MMSLDEQIEIMMAANRGEYLERRGFKPGDGWGEWSQMGQCQHEQFNFMRYEYRIYKEPKCRPFSGLTELIQAVRSHVPFVKAKDKMKCYAITCFGNTNLELSYDGFVSYEGLLKGYVWADDGTPCGVKID